MYKWAKKFAVLANSLFGLLLRIIQSPKWEKKIRIKFFDISCSSCFNSLSLPHLRWDPLKIKQACRKGDPKAQPFSLSFFNCWEKERESCYLSRLCGSLDRLIPLFWRANHVQVAQAQVWAIGRAGRLQILQLPGLSGDLHLVWILNFLEILWRFGDAHLVLCWDCPNWVFAKISDLLPHCSVCIHALVF